MVVVKGSDHHSLIEMNPAYCSHMDWRTKLVVDTYRLRHMVHVVLALLKLGCLHERLFMSEKSSL